MLLLFHLYLCGQASQPGEEVCSLKERHDRDKQQWIHLFRDSSLCNAFELINETNKQTNKR